MKINWEIVAELLSAEVVRCRLMIEKLELEKTLTKQKQTPVENLLNPEEMFKPMRNIVSEGTPS